MFIVSYKGEPCTSHGLHAVRRPSIPAPEEKIEQIEIPGRSGTLTVRDQTYSDIVIPVEFNFMSSQDIFGETFRSAKRWLTGGGMLEFSDDSNIFYKAKFCKITSMERARRIGTFTAEFTCDPFTYYTDGLKEQELSAENVLYNPYYSCNPVYTLTGEANSYVNVNGNLVIVNVGQELRIDTDRLIVYRDTEMANVEASGNIELLRLQEGDNTIYIGEGITAKIIPNWRSL